MSSGCRPVSFIMSDSRTCHGNAPQISCLQQHSSGTCRDCFGRMRSCQGQLEAESKSMDFSKKLQSLSMQIYVPWCKTFVHGGSIPKGTDRQTQQECALCEKQGVTSFLICSMSV